MTCPALEDSFKNSSVESLTFSLLLSKMVESLNNERYVQDETYILLARANVPLAEYQFSCSQQGSGNVVMVREDVNF
jgi:hypothetical protein